MSPTLRLTPRPSLIPKKYLTSTPLLQLAADYVRDGDQFGIIVSVFGGWSIFGAPYFNNVKGRAYSYKIFFGGWDDRQTIQASNESDGDQFGQSVSINEKIVVIGAPYKDNGNVPNEGAVYAFMLMGETCTDDKKLTASDGASSDNFGSSVVISRDTLLVWVSLQIWLQGSRLCVHPCRKWIVGQRNEASSKEWNCLRRLV